MNKVKQLRTSHLNGPSFLVERGCRVEGLQALDADSPPQVKAGKPHVPSIP